VYLSRIKVKRMRAENIAASKINHFLLKVIIIRKWRLLVICYKKLVSKSAITIQRRIRGIFSRKWVNDQRFVICDELLQKCKEKIIMNTPQNLYLRSVSKANNIFDKYDKLDEYAENIGCSYNNSDSELQECSKNSQHNIQSVSLTVLISQNVITTAIVCR
jgi:hypothetical protein